MGNCLGCEQQAMSREAAFEQKKQEAIRYVKETGADMAIFMEGTEWNILRADLCLGRPVREIIRFSQYAEPGQVHAVSV